MPFTLDLVVVVAIVVVVIIVIVMQILVNDIERRTTVGAVKVSQNTSGSLIIDFLVNFFVSAVIQSNDLRHYGGMVVVVLVIELRLHDCSKQSIQTI
jgi:Na+/melibiose symporter-like transporter